MRDVVSGEELTTSMAVSRGILDSTKQKYLNSATGEVLSLDQAIKRSKFAMITECTWCHSSLVTLFQLQNCMSVFGKMLDRTLLALRKIINNVSMIESWTLALICQR